MSEFVISASDETFKKEVLESQIPVLVDFWASWCGPCRMIAPFIDQVAKEFEGKVKVVKCNVDECPQSASAYQVSSIPTLLMFKDGQIVESHSGALPLAQLQVFIQKHL